MPNRDKPSATGWVSALHVKHIVARGEAAGLRMDEVLSEAGVAKASLSDADGGVSVATLESMMQAAARRYSDPLMGLHLAHDIQPATLGALGHISQACTSYEDLVEMVTRYKGLLSNIGNSSVTFAPGQVQIGWECLAGSAFFKRQATEYVMGMLATMSRLLLPEGVSFPQAVHFAHARPEDAEQTRKYYAFFKCPVYFDRPLACLVVATETMKTRLRYGDAFVKDLLARHAQNLLRQREQAASLTDEVRHLIEAMIIEGVPTKDMVAAQLGTSPRSLHRRLEELGTGYRELLDEVRLKMAQDRLRDNAEPVTAIAERLGFSSRQAFLRWFKQCTGKTPGEYQKSVAA